MLSRKRATASTDWPLRVDAGRQRAHLFARDVEAGVVWLNCFDKGDMTSPWGGFKQSGFGRDKGMEALSQYTQTKSVWLDLAHPPG